VKRMTLRKMGLCLLLGVSACTPTSPVNKFPAAVLSKPIDSPVVFTSYQDLKVQGTESQLAQWENKYREMTPPKAVAMALDKNGKWAFGWNESASGTLSAVGGAFAACNQSRNRKSISAPCELIQVNNQQFELGRALAQRLDLGDMSKPTFVWRLEKNDTVVYIGGSFHLFKHGFYPLPAAYTKAFNDTSQLILEVNPVGMTLQQTQILQSKYLFLPEGTTLDQVLPKRVIDTAKEELAVLGIEWHQLEKLTPAGFALNIISALYAVQGFFPQQGIDAYFLKLAVEQSKTLGELETLEFQLQLLADMPFDLQTLQAAEIFGDAKIFDQVNKMVDAWHTADEETLAALMIESSADSPAMKAWNDRLLGERNINMAEKIINMFDTSGKDIFVLVGAGHLSGENNVIHLLQQHGFEISQLRRDGIPL
jgi:uncharacterized protein YbaP (TraB family)